MTLAVDGFELPEAPSALGHALSTRDGGVSAGDFATLNFGMHVGDDPRLVAENRQRFAAAVGYEAAALVTAQQVHGTHVAWVDAGDRGRGALAWDDALPATDGLIVAAAGVPVAVQVADCAPILLVDAARHVLAVVHAGWRGALGRIAAAAVRAMTVAGCDPTAVQAAIGPTLCPTCLEVGDAVAAQVAAEFGEGGIVRAGTKPGLNLRAMIAADLASAGVPPERIVVHPACTRCRNDRYFSHRGQQGRAGRIALVAWWRE